VMLCDRKDGGVKSVKKHDIINKWPLTLELIFYFFVIFFVKLLLHFSKFLVSANFDLVTKYILRMKNK